MCLLFVNIVVVFPLSEHTIQYCQNKKDVASLRYNIFFYGSFIIFLVLCK
ncbi:hypothetical protein HMPREF9419_0669 [Prevotella nigrescens ATCC 33563]|nr:hypothetical protein HMPREF9419_0669 [Prevotella nigrescens ATCC 33563]